MKNILKISLFAILFVMQFGFFLPTLVQAAESEKIPLTNPLGGTKENKEGSKDITLIGATAIQTAMGVLGSITLLVFVVGGVMWLTSQGNPERVQMGSKTMLYAVIGLFVIFAAYAILNAVITGLTG